MSNVVISDSIKYIGADDTTLDLFESQYQIPHGVSYNSYVILDEKIAVMDTIDARKGDEWMANLETVLAGRTPDYLVISHLEPDHAANIKRLADHFPEMKLVLSAKAKAMLPQFFDIANLNDRCITVAEGNELELGSHKLKFFMAPMVHWPEVMVEYEETEKVLFSADGFGKFGALCYDDEWTDEARRYYINIVGKYGTPVQTLLKKAATLDIQTICPLHGPVLKENLGFYIDKYMTWSSYTPEEDGVLVACASIHGNTRAAAEKMVEILKSKGADVVFTDLTRDDMAEAVSNAFRYSKLVLAAASYDAGVFPPMEDFLNRLSHKAFQKRAVALIENGSWAPLAAKVMKNMLSECKKINWLDTTVKIMSAVDQENRDQMEAMASELCKEYIAKNDELANKNDMTALFRIGYGLYVVTSNDGKKDNGLIVNTVTQLTDSPFRVAVNINKTNYSHHVIKQTGVMNVNCLSVEAPFSVFEQFGFQSGRSVDKFAGQKVNRSDNGLIFLDKYINAFMSLKVEQYVDLGTHGMFICSVTEARVVSDQETMSYTYYQKNVKPKPETEGKKGFVCKVCGYIYEGDELPEDYICPLCKHGAVDFEPIG